MEVRNPSARKTNNVRSSSVYTLLGHYVEARATTIRRRQYQWFHGGYQDQDRGASAGAGEVQLDRPRHEQRTNRCEGRKSEREQFSKEIAHCPLFYTQM